MPEYDIGGQVVRRKNFYRPCGMDEEFEKAEGEALAKLFRETAWCDVLTKSEWPVVLQAEGTKPYTRSKLKKKVAGWILALEHTAELHPELFEEIYALVKKVRAEQFEANPDLPVLLAWNGDLLVSGDNVEVGTPVDWHPETAAEAG